jgi:hypothetical protein
MLLSIWIWKALAVHKLSLWETAVFHNRLDDGDTVVLEIIVDLRDEPFDL